MERLEFVKALDFVQYGLSNKEIIEQTDSFVFNDGRVITYNDEISVSHPIENLNIAGVVKASELYKIISKFKNDTLNITVDGNELQIKCGKAKAGLVFNDEILLPLEEMDTSGKWDDLPELFSKGMDLVHHTCSNDMSTPVFSCVNITLDGKLQSTDAYRVTQFDMGNDIDLEYTLIPSKVAKIIKKFNPIKFKKSNGWVHFKNELGTILSTRFLDDKFPDGIEDLLSLEGAETIQFPKNIGEILDRANIFCSNDHLEKEVTITMKGNKIKIQAKTDSGWFEEVAKADYDGDEIQFRIHPLFLKDICSKITSCEITDDKIKFTGDEWTHLISLPE